MNPVDIKNLPFNTFYTIASEEGLKSFSKEEIIEMLDKSGLDLVEVKGGSHPIYKIIDYEKFLYVKDKAQKQKKKRTVQKEIKIGLNIAPHDIEVKIKNIKRILKEKNKIKIVIAMRGREIFRTDAAIELLNSILPKIDNGKPYSAIKTEGRFVSITVGPD